MGILDDLKANFRQGNVLIRLIYINVGLFILFSLTSSVLMIFKLPTLEGITSYLFAFPSNIHVLVYKPWTIITYMFMHADIWHILFNMLWLYWFGQIFLQYLSHKQLLSVYLLGGFSGAALYFLAYNLLPAFDIARWGSEMVGASAAIMAIVISISLIMPNYAINLLFFGAVKLKYIAIFSIVIDAISIQSGNAGGHIAHLGGAFFGYLFALRYHKGKDITKSFSNFLDKFFGLFKSRKRMKVSYKRPVDDLDYNKSKVDKQKEIDRILDKIAKGGYESLSKSEKDFLFKASK